MNLTATTTERTGTHSNWREILRTEFATSLVALCGILDGTYSTIPPQELLTFLLELHILGNNQIYNQPVRGGYLLHYDSSQSSTRLTSCEVLAKLLTEFSPAVCSCILQYSVFQHDSSLRLAHWSPTVNNITLLQQPHLVLVLKQSERTGLNVEDLIPIYSRIALVLTN